MSHLDKRASQLHLGDKAAPPRPSMDCTRNRAKCTPTSNPPSVRGKRPGLAIPVTALNGQTRLVLAHCLPTVFLYSILAYVRLFVNLGRSKDAFWQRDYDAMAEELAKGPEVSQVSDSTQRLKNEMPPPMRRASQSPQDPLQELTRQTSRESVDSKQLSIEQEIRRFRTLCPPDNKT